MLLTGLRTLTLLAFTLWAFAFPCGAQKHKTVSASIMNKRCFPAASINCQTCQAALLTVAGVADGMVVLVVAGVSWPAVKPTMAEIVG